MWPHDVKSQGVEPEGTSAPAEPQSQSASSAVNDTRRLAVRRCILTCLTNGWAPSAESVWRLVALRESWLRGERREDAPDEEELARLRFARWLYEQGRIGS